MSEFARSCLIALSAAAVAVPGVARAVSNPNDTFLGSDLQPNNRTSICFGAECGKWTYLYGAETHIDCNKAGFPAPRIGMSFDPAIPGGWRFGGIDSGVSGSPPTGELRAREWLRRNSNLPYGYADLGSGWAAGIGPFSQPYIQRPLDTDPAPTGDEGRIHTTESGAKVRGMFDRPSLYLYYPLNLRRDDFDYDWPSGDSRYPNAGADQGPAKGALSPPGGSLFTGPDAQEMWNKLWNMNRNDLIDEYESTNIETLNGELPEKLEPFLDTQYQLGGTTWSSLTYSAQYAGDVRIELRNAGISSERNGCRDPKVPTDPNYLRTSRHGGNSWGGTVDDQWAIKRVGFSNDESSAWNLLPDNAEPVIVAVIDSGLDWHHLDISGDNIWRNTAEDPGNGIDDDSNGYIDDVIGWDFIGKNNKPWDHDGHGTVVTGIIAARHNDAGIAGINPNVKIMVLKAVNDFGHTRASYIAEAIVYAVDNGARVINISLGGPHTSRMEQAAIEYAHQEGVLVVVAAGNEEMELTDYGPGGDDHALTVGATHFNDRAAAFSNFGNKVDIAAPGVDVLSLRARFTDANYRPDGVDNGADEYVIGTNYVGEDKRYLRASGTSFSTPIVAGIASLIFSKDPGLRGADVRRILEQTATDVDLAGNDKYTGHGMVNAQAALSADRGFSITAEIADLEFVQTETSEYVRVRGTIDASDFKRAWMQIGPGENPGGWRYVGQKRKYPIIDGTLGTIPIRDFAGNELWQVVINVEHKNGVVKRAVRPVKIK